MVTETLYAIHHKGWQWPDEIRLITTKPGQQRAATGLLENGHLDRLCHEIGRPRPIFDPSHILVVPNADNQAVEDARSEQDHEALANFIMALVRELSATDQKGQAINALSIHASLSGGRRTMTFYMGYAMSLFGRKQDRLSHVLVNDTCYENSDFWFPTVDPAYRYLKNRDGQPILNSHGQPAEATPQQAEVTLADIPFIRQRHQLPGLLSHQAHTAVNFRDIVALVNLAEDRDSIALTIDRMQRTITVACTDPAAVEPIVLTDIGYLEIALYATCAFATLNNQTVTRPRKDTPSIELLGQFLAHLLPMLGLDPDERPIDSLDILESYLKQQKDDDSSVIPLNLKSLSALRGEKHAELDEDKELVRDAGVTLSWFDDRRTHLRQHLEERLPSRMLEYLLPSRATQYRIDLPLANITLI